MAAPDDRTGGATLARRLARRPAPSSWLFLAVAGLYELSPAARASWDQLAPSLPAAGPPAILLVASLFGLGFHHVRLAALCTLLAAVLWLADPPGATAATDPQAVLFMLALNLAWIGLWPTRARLAWRWLAGLLLIAVQAATAGLWAPAASSLVAGATERFGLGAADVWLPAGTLLGLLPWIARAVLAGAGLPLAVVWSCLCAEVVVRATGDPSSRQELYAWLAAAVLLLAVAEASYRLAYTDELTGLPGRRALADALAHARGDFALAIVDIDHFKSFNDRHGHDVGDQVLRRVAGELRTVSGSGAYRHGGEEFVLVFARAGPAEAEQALERLRRQISARRFTVRAADRPRRRPASLKPAAGQQQRKITVSIGLAGSRPGDRSALAVLERADQALYRAKRAGRNRLVVAGRRAAPTRRRATG
ncbi:MAG TPA: GGDEF domain-containing protein [Thermoanaerobaculia bacterium]|nr:GGDEF domain-containing protein [Thermoanaerobaculia bacterium]